MRRLLVLATTAAAAVLVTACGPVTASPPAAPTTPTWATEMLQRVNAERAAVGAAPLRLCSRLTFAAQAHSQDQAWRSVMSHTGSNGSTMVQRVESAGYRNWSALAENVAAGQPHVQSVMNAWMGSSGHRTNLLSRSYEHVGFGLAASRSGANYWTQNFGRSGTC